MITNLNLYNNVLGNSANAVATGSTQNTKSSVESTEKDSENKSTNVVANNNIYISNRSLKLSNISQEFFSGGQLTFDDIDRLKDKLYQYGLISKNDHVDLTGSNETKQENKTSESLSTTTLSNFIGDFVERLNTDKKSDGEDEKEPVEESETIKVFTKALKIAESILANVEEQKGKDDFKSDLKESMSVINNMINDESFANLPLDDQAGLSKIYQALEIVDSLSPQRLSNAKLNQYIDLSLR